MYHLNNDIYASDNNVKETYFNILSISSFVSSLSLFTKRKAAVNWKINNKIEEKYLAKSKLLLTSKPVNILAVINNKINNNKFKKWVL